MEQYIILGRIGEGAHGVVFKAKDREVGLERGAGGPFWGVRSPLRGAWSGRGL